MLKKPLFKRRVNPYYNPEKAHHRPYGFENIPPTKIDWRDLLRWMQERRQKKLPKAPKAGYQTFIEENMVPLHYPERDQSTLIWLGHSSLYISTPEVALVTDPIFSHRASPLSFLGPLRKTPATDAIESMPRLDLILISHNHYDHLDERTILELYQKFPEILVIVPLGLKPWFLKRGIERVVELDWWDSEKLSTSQSPLEITAVPAQHWSKRGFLDRNASLWCGYIIQIGEKTLYFAGDTGFTPLLKEIGERFSIDIGLIPIGAYEPRWFMAPQHISPKEAVEIHQMLNIKQSIGIHWGVFELTDEALDEPPRYLKQSLKAANCQESEFIALPINGTWPL